MAWRISQLVRRLFTGLQPAEVIHRIDVKDVRSGPNSIRLKKKNDKLFVELCSRGLGEFSSVEMDVKEFMAVIDAMLVTKSVIQNSKKSS